MTFGNESINDLEEKIRILKLIPNKTLSQEKVLKDIELQIKEVRETISKFNKIFSKYGWILHEMGDFHLFRKALFEYENNRLETALEFLLDSYSAEKIEWRLISLKSLEVLKKRSKFIDFAYKDYQEGKYYSVVPLLLMIIDGAVNEVCNKGFHAKSVDVNAWDSLTSYDEGIETIKTIFQKGRFKTEVEQITLPFRNGILHGMDLGYDNYEVAAKCWSFLFYIRDFLTAKISENTRKGRAKEEKNVSISNIIQKHESSIKQKELARSWVKREITKNDLDKINTSDQIDENLPEGRLLRFFQFWNKKNYGYMVKILGRNVKDVRSEFDIQELENFKILTIEDISPAITEISAKLNKVGFPERTFLYRLIYEDEDGGPLVRNTQKGQWIIKSFRPLRGVS